jgi:general secretion pathway protein E
MEPKQSPARAANVDRHVTIEDVLYGLIKDGMVDRKVADGLLATSKLRQYDHPLNLVAEQKWRALALPNRVMTLETLCQWYATRISVPYVRIDPFTVDFQAVSSVMSATYAKRYKVLPLSVTPETVTIATSEPNVRSWMPELAGMLRRRIEIVFANPLDIARYSVEFFSLAQSVRRANERTPSDRPELASFEQLVRMGASGTPDANDSHIVKIVDWFWQYAFDQRASDIHIEPRRDSGIVRFRIDGILHQVYQVPIGVLAAMVSRIKLLARMEIVEKRRPQDGRIKTVTADGVEIELRVSTMPTAFGEKVVMRVFDPEVLQRSFDELGFVGEDRALWDEMIARPHGIVLVTGPTGSGKTTTLYSTLKLLATPEVNVCTIEDPIEMIEPAFNQMQVQPALGVDFETGVRTLMRQDPDIIMVGEIRDLPTAEMAIQAALTGHLVLSTLHTNDAPTAITRLIDLGVPPYLINSTLIGVMAQRLVRTLCMLCREPAAPMSEEMWASFTISSPNLQQKNAYAAVGCLECRMTGFRGRAGIFEMLLMSPDIRKCISAGASLDYIREQAFREGMRSLRAAGAEKIANGLTTASEVERVAPPV